MEYKKTTWNKTKKKRVKVKHPKKSTVWANFSRYIRARDCLATTGTLTECVCVTCQQKFPLARIQAGHAMAGRKNAILFDEELVNGQCEVCNGYRGGAYELYALWFIRKYGIEGWEEKIKLNVGGVQFKGWQLSEINEKYKLKYKQLLETYGK